MTRGEACRELAQELRELVAQYSDDPDGIYDQELLCVLGVGLGSSDDSVDPADVRRLATLIDRPTCRFQSEAAVHGILSMFGICTRCGAIVDPLTTFCSDNRLMPANFCPCCGAEVMRDDD